MSINVVKHMKKSAARDRQIRQQKQYFSIWLNDEIKKLKFNKENSKLMHKMALIGYERGVQERV